MSAEQFQQVLQAIGQMAQQQGQGGSRTSSTQAGDREVHEVRRVLGQSGRMGRLGIHLQAGRQEPELGDLQSDHRRREHGDRVRRDGGPAEGAGAEQWRTI